MFPVDTVDKKLTHLPSRRLLLDENTLKMSPQRPSFLRSVKGGDDWDEEVVPRPFCKGLTGKR